MADCAAAKALLEHLLPTTRVLHGDKGDDTNPVRQQVEANGTLPNIPPKANRIWKSCFSPVLYRARNAIERMFCRLKDFRRIATRYDRLATNFLAAVCLAATVSCWLWVTDGAELIEERPSCCDQTRADPVQRLDIELLLALELDKAHRRP